MDDKLKHWVNVAFQHFYNLPKTGKPSINQWTVLSAIIMTHKENTSECKIVSLGTGTKCLGKGKLSIKGKVVNDMHAEIIARRSFICFVYNEIMKMCLKKESIFKWDSNSNKCLLDKNYEFHMISTSLPCGDACIFPVENILELPKDLIDKHKKPLSLKRSLEFSNELNDKKLKINDIKINEITSNVINNKGILANEYNSSKKTSTNFTTILNDDIHRTGAKCLETSIQKDLFGPGAIYHVTQVLRTKPGRGDKTLSMSCSDKIAKWNVIGIQGALQSLILHAPIYLKSIIVTSKLYSEESFRRAIFDRISYMNNIPDPYCLNSPQIYNFTDLKFRYDKEFFTEDSKPANTSIMWYEGISNVEVLTNGKKLGVIKKNENDLNSCSLICKANLFKKFKETLTYLKENYNSHSKFLNNAMTYNECKNLSEVYNTCWNNLKEQIFSEWPSDSIDYEQFT